MSKFKVLLKVTGSIAAYKSCELASRLVKAGYQVRVAASKNSLQFVGAATWEGLTGNAVYSDLWASGQMMDHIEVNRWADIVVVAPASASFINRAAAGTGDDLLATLFLAHDFSKPYLIAPAMNQAMYNHPVTTKSLASLRDMGLQILEPGTGSLACGEIGPGRLMEPADIFSKIENTLSRKPLRGKILITSGGTREAIDDVRAITNISTGATGSCIADELIQQGFEVTYLAAESAVKPSLPCRKIEFRSFQDLQSLLKQELSQEYQGLIHAAAVSDYSPDQQVGKISSRNDDLEIRLHKNPKLVNHVLEWSSNKNLKLIAFKLTSTPSEKERLQAVTRLAHDSGAELVIQNDFSTIEKSPGTHHFVGYKNSQTLFEAESKIQLAQKLTQYLQENTL